MRCEVVAAVALPPATASVAHEIEMVWPERTIAGECWRSLGLTAACATRAAQLDAPG